MNPTYVFTVTNAFQGVPHYLLAFAYRYGTSRRVITPRGAKQCRLYKIGTFCWPYMALGKCAYIRLFKEKWWKYFCRFFFVCFISKTNLNSMILIKFKQKIIYWLYKFMITPLSKIFHPDRIRFCKSLSPFFLGLGAKPVPAETA